MAVLLIAHTHANWSERHQARRRGRHGDERCDPAAVGTADQSVVHTTWPSSTAPSRRITSVRYVPRLGAPSGPSSCGSIRLARRCASGARGSGADARVARPVPARETYEAWTAPRARPCRREHRRRARRGARRTCCTKSSSTRRSPSRRVASRCRRRARRARQASAPPPARLRDVEAKDSTPSGELDAIKREEKQRTSVCDGVAPLSHHSGTRSRCSARLPRSAVSTARRLGSARQDTREAAEIVAAAASADQRAWPTNSATSSRRRERGAALASSQSALRAASRIPPPLREVERLALLAGSICTRRTSPTLDALGRGQAQVGLGCRGCSLSSRCVSPASSLGLHCGGMDTRQVRRRGLCAGWEVRPRRGRAAATTRRATRTRGRRAETPMRRAGVAPSRRDPGQRARRVQQGPSGARLLHAAGVQERARRCSRRYARDRARRRWLRTTPRTAPLSSATGRQRTRLATWTNVALTHSGLARARRPRRELLSFPRSPPGHRRRADIVGDAVRATVDVAGAVRRRMHGVVILAADRPGDLRRAPPPTGAGAEHGLDVVHVDAARSAPTKPGTNTSASATGCLSPVCAGSPRSRWAWSTRSRRGGGRRRGSEEPRRSGAAGIPGRTCLARRVRAGYPRQAGPAA